MGTEKVKMSISISEKAASILAQYARGLHLSKSGTVEIALLYMSGDRGDRLTRRIVEMARAEMARQEQEVSK